MTEIPPEPEKEAIKFTRNDLTPLEHVMIGSSTEITVNGNTMLVNSQALEELQRNKDAWKAVLMPISLTKGLRTLEEVSRVRKNGELFSGPLALFEFEPQWDYMEKGIRFTFGPGELDQNGQLRTFGIFPLRNGQKISLPNNPEKEVPLHKSFANIIEYLGEENMTMRFRIKT